MTDRTEFIPIAEGNPHPLGRHVHHDERSKDYPAATAPDIHDVDWPHFGPILNQGNLGSCTGHALVDCLMTGPNYRATRKLTHAAAVKAYSRATQIDPFPGQWPPTDTGSDGLDVCRAGVEFGWLTGYDHAFGIDHLLGALMLGPVMVGTSWYDSMFKPDAQGRVTVSGSVAGGHEYAITAKQGDWLRILNSWGARWGVGGFAWISVADMTSLLNAQGDCTVPKPAP